GDRRRRDKPDILLNSSFISDGIIRLKESHVKGNPEPTRDQVQQSQIPGSPEPGNAKRTLSEGPFSRTILKPVTVIVK
ncbi:MAG: hypothetical protein PVJ01_04035, partial [Pseudomonadota bacterium]